MQIVRLLRSGGELTSLMSIKPPLAASQFDHTK